MGEDSGRDPSAILQVGWGHGDSEGSSPAPLIAVCVPVFHRRLRALTRTHWGSSILTSFDRELFRKVRFHRQTLRGFLVSW